MKILSSFMLLSLVLSFGPRTLAINLGDKMPAVSSSMKGIDGKMYNLASQKKSKGTLVAFTCNHCPYVKMWEDRLAILSDEFKDQVGVIHINSNDPEGNPLDNFEGMQKRGAHLAKVVAEHKGQSTKSAGLSYPYVVDDNSEAARAFGAEKTPEIFLFDAEGILVYKGAVDDSADPKDVKEQWLRMALSDLVAGRKIAKASTKAVGCGIRFRSKDS